MDTPLPPRRDHRAETGIAGALGVAALVGGLAVALYGLLLLPASLLGGAHVVAIGLSLAAAGAFATDRVGDRLGLSTARRQRLALGFGGVALLLAVAFVVVNYAAFGGPFAESGSETAAAAIRFGVPAAA